MSAIDEAFTALTGKAIYDGPEHDVHVRIAGTGDSAYLDLGDSEWRVVEVTREGWRVIPGKDAPVRFVRKRGMLALPAPIKGGKVDELRPLLNLPDDTSWALLVGCLVGYLRPTGPYPILIVDGEQGSAKSTTCRLLVRLIDPRKAPLRRPPKNERDLMIAASNGWLAAFDNLSGLQPWLSDTICSLATGGGFAARQLFTDGNLKLFDAMRPVLMNGIDRVATRSDLLDRAVSLHLPNIPEELRLQKRELDARFEAAHPRVLGALLDAVAAGLRRHDSVQLNRTPRMADFATWVTAAEPALGWKPGTFLDAYLANREEANEVAIEASSVGSAVLAFAQKQVSWEGTAEELLALLELGEGEHVSLCARARLPKTPTGLGKALRRVAPNFRASGVIVEFLPREGRRRPIRVVQETHQSVSLINRPKAILTEEDKAWLLVNLDIMAEGGPDDHQAQRVYDVEANVIDSEAPVWTTAQVEAYVKRFSREHVLRVKLCWRDQHGAASFVGRGGGVLLLESSRNSGEFVFVEEGFHVGSIVVHELAHILTPQLWRKPQRYGRSGFESHGPEFVRCYLTLLAEHMNVEKAEAAFRYMGISIAPESNVSRR